MNSSIQTKYIKKGNLTVAISFKELDLETDVFHVIKKAEISLDEEIFTPLDISSEKSQQHICDLLASEYAFEKVFLTEEACYQKDSQILAELEEMKRFEQYNQSSLAVIG